MDAALTSQRNLQRDIAESLALTLDELSSGFTVAGDDNAAFECATESLALTTPSTPVASPMTSTPNGSQRARTLRRLARLKRSDSHRTEEYLRQAAEVDPLVSGVHYAAYMHYEKEYYSAVMAVLPAVVARSESGQRQHFDTSYFPSVIQQCADQGDEEADVDVRCYACFIAFDCYRMLGLAEDCRASFKELLSEVDVVLERGQYTFEPSMAAFACMCFGYYTKAASYFHLCTSNAITWYWMCVCLSLAQTVLKVGSYVTSIANIPQEYLNTVSTSNNPTLKRVAEINDLNDLSEANSNISHEVTNCCDLLDNVLVDDTLHTNISFTDSTTLSDHNEEYELYSEDNGDNRSDSLRRESETSVSVASDVDIDAYIDHISEHNNNLVDEHISNRISSETSHINNSQGNDVRKIPTELELEPFDGWQHEEETISTPEVILEVLRNLQDNNMQSTQLGRKVKDEQKMSLNSEISNFDECELPSSDSEEEEIFQTWEEYTEYPEGLSDKVNHEENSDIKTTEGKVYTKEIGSVEDKGYNSDNDWVTSEEIVDTPDVIIQAMQNKSTLY